MSAHNRLESLISDFLERSFCSTISDRYDEMFDLVMSVYPFDAPPKEMQNYASSDFKRFLYTLELVLGYSTGSCLEIGSNPYFTTMLLKRYTDLELTLTNYFGDTFTGPLKQIVCYTEIKTGEKKKTDFNFDHFNVETDSFPYEDNRFDIVLFCEVIEHMTNDPMRVLLEIQRILKNDGVLILTTPNVARLENVAKMFLGMNIYDPYSAYGPYGRHNREYNRHEINQLCTHVGFKEETSFTADVNGHYRHYLSGNEDICLRLQDQKNRVYDLGQYLFFRFINKKKRKIEKHKPDFLYRSYSELETKKL